MLHISDNIPAVSTDFDAIMREHGIMPTQQRLEIAQILLARPQHMSADQVLALANRKGASVSKATVYNTLKLFAAKGLVREVIVDPTKVFYDSTTAPHYHIYNVDTGTLMDVDSAQVAVGGLPDLPSGTVAEGIDVIVRVRNKPLATA